MIKRLRTVIFFLLIILALSGCWDKTEIEDRAFVMALGIDSTTSSKRYIVTFQFPNVSQIAKGTSGGGGGGGKASFSVSEVADTIFSASRHVSTRLNKSLYLGHIQAVILGKDIVSNKDKFQEVLDSLDRSYELSRKLYLVVTPGRAQDILLKDYKFDPNTGAYIRDVFRHYNRTSIFPNIDYNKVMKSLHETNGNAIMPKIIAGKDEIKVAGAAIIKNYRLAGWMEDGENMGYMWLTGLVKGGDITFSMPGDGEEIKVPFNITNVITRKGIEEKNGKIIYKIKLDVEGDVTEYSFEKHSYMMNTNVLKIMEKKANNTIEGMIKKALVRFQKELKVDMLGVGDYIQKYKPGLWKKVGTDWDKVFPDIEVKVEVSTHIRRIGLFR